MRPAVIPRRLVNHGLTRPMFAAAADVVSWYGAVQGQEYRPSTWGIAQRTAGLTSAELDRAFDAGEILRTHILRATWHFVAPADLRWMQLLTSPRVQALNAYWYRVNGLSARVLARGADVIARSLEGGAELTRPELAERLRRARIQATGPRLAGIVMHAELEAVICSGPRRGTQITYALVDERVAPTTPLTRDEALAELTRRYFRSHGPATVRDFVWWSGLRVADARAGIALAGLRDMRLGDLTCWAIEGQPPPPRAAASVRLLPIYDEYFVAYRDRESITARIEGYDTFANYLLVDGRLCGTWRATGEEVSLMPARALDARHAALAAREVARYQRFLRG